MLGVSLLGVTPATLADSGKSSNFPARIDLPNGWRPEGITAGRGTDLYVGSLANGAIWKTDARTGAGAILTPGATGMVSVGLDYDTRNDRLWVAGGGTQEVRAVDASTGAILQRYPVLQAPAATSFLNDVAVTRQAIYITDTRNPWINVIPTARNGTLPAANAARRLMLTGQVFNAGNGIVYSDGWLIVVSAGNLYRVDPQTGDSRLINITGSASTPPLLNGDGLELHDDELYVVQNRLNQIAKIELADDLLSGEVDALITSPGNLDVPTTVALQAGRLWAVNARFGVALDPPPAFWITQLDPDGGDDDNDEDDDDD